MTRSLTPFEHDVLVNKATEAPFTGLYVDTKSEGAYHCKACNAKLYNSTEKFDSRCGWPSFDQEIAGAVKRVADVDGRRTEIICASCNGHLGHVFEGEGYTPKNTRHCVNSVSLQFVPAPSTQHLKALFASGCFWGTEYYMARIPGVIHTAVGFAGGHVENPDYKTVCGGKTGHLECVEVTYDPTVVDYAALCRMFFETHNFSQENGQGPDIGPQYLSAIFYQDDKQRAIIDGMIAELQKMGHKVATLVKPSAKFWPAGPEHRQYYERKGTTPYCHHFTKIF
jgi:peptide methionine sulfoxide reductase msrA/msrB